MKFLQDTSIRKKIVFIIMLTSSITLLFASLSYLLYDALKVRQTIKDEMVSLAEIISSNSAAAIMFNDQRSAQKTLSTLQDHAHIVAAYIITPDNRIFASYSGNHQAQEKLKGDIRKDMVPLQVNAGELQRLHEQIDPHWDIDLFVAKKIILDNDEVGSVVIQAHALGTIIARMKWFIGLTLIVTVCSFLIALALSAKLQYLISEPILGLTQLMKTISATKTYSLRAGRGGSDELGILYDGFNEILYDIQKRDEKLAEYHRHLEEEIGKRTRASDEWRATFDATTDIIIMLDRNSVVIKANKACSLFLDKPFHGIVGQSIYELLGDTGIVLNLGLLSHVEATRTHQGTDVYIPQREQWLSLSVDPVLNDQGLMNGSVLIIRDVSSLKTAEEEQMKLQTQLWQVQKMDSIGRLAGGIAHDFNNILSSIMGYSELVMMKMSDQDPLKEKLKIIHSSGEKAASLTRQLLLFSRKESVAMKVIDLRHVVDGMKKMLVRLIGENIRFDVNVSPGLHPIHGDSGQLEQVLMNLVVNARDAMPAGGTLQIRAENFFLQDKLLPEANPGTYVRIEVSDTGEGMTKEIQEKIFEPFFTTKPIGKGTGIGLATVYGIVQQHNGHIMVNSEPGKGTAFGLYFPAAQGTLEIECGQSIETDLNGSGTILVAEDDDQLRKLIRTTLEMYGYRVVEAVDGQDAVEKYHEHKEYVQLILLDVIMPNMNGKEAYTNIREIQPGIKVLFMSGYTADIVSPQGILEEGIELIQKPISRNDLLARVRTILDK